MHTEVRGEFFMPVETVIDEIDQILFHLLDDADWTLPDFQKPLITFESPRDIQEHPSEDNKLCIYLYQISENVYMKNREPERFGESRVGYPPLYLDLYYILVPYSKRKSHERLILGTAIKILANHPVLNEGLLQGNLEKTDHAIRLLFNSLTLDDLTKIWSAFQTTGYHLSVSYLVTPVPVEIALETTFQRVVSKEMKYSSGLPSPDRTKVYTVKQGDSLWLIASREYGDASRWHEIARWNAITDPRILEPGRELILRPLE